MYLYTVYYKDACTHGTGFLQVPKKAPIKFLCEQIAALRGTRNLDYLGDMSWLPRDLRLAFYLPQLI